MRGGTFNAFDNSTQNLSGCAIYRSYLYVKYTIECVFTSLKLTKYLSLTLGLS